MKKKLFISLLSLSIGMFCAQSFVVKKQEKPKKESRSQLKERACQTLYNLLNGLTDMLGALSSAQRVLLGTLADYVAQEKKNVIDSATDDELKALANELEDVAKSAKNLEAKLLFLAGRFSKK